MCVYPIISLFFVALPHRSTDKLKGTIQLLHDSTDEWNVGEDTVDLRMPRKTFARVQKYVPECQVLIENVEEHIRKAEAQMFPARLQEEEAWAKMVLENVLKTKVQSSNPLSLSLSHVYMCVYSLAHTHTHTAHILAITHTRQSLSQSLKECG